MERFYLDEYIKKTDVEEEVTVYANKNERIDLIPREINFEEICALIYSEFRLEWEDENANTEKLLEIEKKAITGYAPEVSFFKQKIRFIINQRQSLTI